MSRANPMWCDFSDAVDVLAIFHEPDAYISPSWYAANYAVVHAAGPLRIVDDVQWLRGLVERLARQIESPRSRP